MRDFKQLTKALSERFAPSMGQAGVEVSAGTAAVGSRRDAGRFCQRPDTSR